MTLAPPSGSPAAPVTRPRTTASCAASGMVNKHAIATNFRTRISGLFCGEETRWGRRFEVYRCSMTDPLGPRPTAGRDGPADFGVQHFTTRPTIYSTFYYYSR